MRLRHNKKRNTAFVYEALVRELTKSIIKNNGNRKNKIVSIMKEHFKKGTALSSELDIYKSLYETSSLNEVIAEKLMIEAKFAYSKLNKKQIFEEQTSLINKVNKILSPNVFSNFVPNYKNLASIYSIFNDSVTVKEKVLLESKMLEFLTNNEKKEEEAKEPIDNVVYKSFVARFNKEYFGSLNESQKALLTKYVASFADEGLELKVHLNEEVGKLKESLKDCLKNSDISKDPSMFKKTEEVLKKVESYRTREIDETMLEEILKIQSLVEEIQSDGN